MLVLSSAQEGFQEKHGVKLGFMSAFVKASSDALRLVPAVNAVIEGDELVYRDYTDISIAVATPKGLVVPVLRNVDALNFAGIEKVRLAWGQLLSLQMMASHAVLFWAACCSVWTLMQMDAILLQQSRHHCAVYMDDCWKAWDKCILHKAR